MNDLGIEHVAVLLDPLAVRGGAFLQAVDWASNLEVPLRIVGRSSSRADALLDGALGVPGEECAAACAERGVALDVVECSQLGASAQHLLRSRELTVFCGGLPAKIRETFLRWSVRARDAAILVCPAVCSPVSRVLILHAPQGNAGGFFAAALTACRVVGGSPVILTVARTERQARRRQLVAERACYANRMAAHLDYVAGVDVPAAVASIARWRRCSHVVLEQRQAVPWWRRLRGDTLERLLGSTDSLTFLALPEAGLQAAADRPALDCSTAH
jgi:hypothetical protein